MYITDNESLARSIVLTAMRLENLGNRFIFEPLGLTAASLKIVGLLHHLGPMTPSAIGERLGSTKSNITQRLNFLEKKGLVSRQASKSGQGDGRSVSVCLTAYGRRQLKLINSALKEHQLHIAKYFTPEEIQANLDFLKRFNEILDQCPKQGKHAVR